MQTGHGQDDLVDLWNRGRSWRGRYNWRPVLMTVEYTKRKIVHVLGGITIYHPFEGVSSISKGFKFSSCREQIPSPLDDA